MWPFALQLFVYFYLHSAKQLSCENSRSKAKDSCLCFPAYIISNDGPVFQGCQVKGAPPLPSTARVTLLLGVPAHPIPATLTLKVAQGWLCDCPAGRSWFTVRHTGAQLPATVPLRTVFFVPLWHSWPATAGFVFWTLHPMVTTVPFLPVLYLAVSRVHGKNNQLIWKENLSKTLLYFTRPMCVCVCVCKLYDSLGCHSSNSIHPDFWASRLGWLVSNPWDSAILHL